MILLGALPRVGSAAEHQQARVLACAAIHLGSRLLHPDELSDIPQKTVFVTSSDMINV